MGCYVDCEHEIYDNCVIDKGKPEDCSIALENRFTDRKQCRHWFDEKVCECCGQRIPVEKM